MTSVYDLDNSQAILQIYYAACEGGPNSSTTVYYGLASVTITCINYLNIVVLCC